MRHGGDLASESVQKVVASRDMRGSARPAVILFGAMGYPTTSGLYEETDGEMTGNSQHRLWPLPGWSDASSRCIAAAPHLDIGTCKSRFISSNCRRMSGRSQS